MIFYAQSDRGENMIAKQQPESNTKKHDKKSMESFEPIPLMAACLTYLGFYFLMLLGFLNQLLFTPKVATEKNRQVLRLLNYQKKKK